MARKTCSKASKNMCKYLSFISDLLLHQLPGAVPAGVADVDPDPGAGPGELQGGA